MKKIKATKSFLSNGQGVREHSLLSRETEGLETAKQDLVAEEKAVAMIYNGISHAVMMASPIDLKDFATGFSLTEGIVENPNQIRNIHVVESDLGYEVQMDIASSSFMQLKQRRRQLSGRSGCGICGLESLQAVMPTVNPVNPQQLPSFQIIEKAIDKMKQQQVLQAQCGAVHAAAYTNIEGDILEIREDIGRHNALDKLLGSIAHSGIKECNPGFVLVSSRASFEMVAKSASQSISTLVAVSAPTDLAIELAIKAKMNLIGFVRPGRQLIYSTSTGGTP